MNLRRSLNGLEVGHGDGENDLLVYLCLTSVWEKWRRNNASTMGIDIDIPENKPLQPYGNKGIGAFGIPKSENMVLVKVQPNTQKAMLDAMMYKTMNSSCEFGKRVLPTFYGSGLMNRGKYRVTALEDVTGAPWVNFTSFFESFRQHPALLAKTETDIRSVLQGLQNCGYHDGLKLKSAQFVVSAYGYPSRIKVLLDFIPFLYIPFFGSGELPLHFMPPVQALRLIALLSKPPPAPPSPPNKTLRIKPAVKKKSKVKKRKRELKTVF